MVRETMPQFMPLNAPETRTSGGRILQSPEGMRFKDLAPSDYIPGAKVKSLDQHDQLTEQAQKWVAQTFYGTLLKQMHDSPFKAAWVDGGRGGEAFQPLLDQKIVDHLARTSGKKLVRSLVRKMEGQRAYAKQAKRAAGRRDLNQARMPSAEAPPDDDGAPGRSMPRNYVAPGLRA